MEIPEKSDLILPEKYESLTNMVLLLLLSKGTEERFEHWGFLSFSEAVSKLISVSLVSKISQN